MEKPRVKDLVEATGISKAYASAIIKNHEQAKDGQAPSLPVAATIFAKTGWRHRIVVDLADETLTDLAATMPWEKAA